jgi:hypothetical protein
VSIYSLSIARPDDPKVRWGRGDYSGNIPTPLFQSVYDRRSDLRQRLVRRTQGGGRRGRGNNRRSSKWSLDASQTDACRFYLVVVRKELLLPKAV